MGNEEINWLLYSTLTGVVIFAILNFVIFWRVWKLRPELLKNISCDGRRVDTTLNWNIIIMISAQCSTLAAGLFIIMNVLLFLVSSRWYIDSRSIGIMVVAFAILLLRSFDSFWTRLFNA